MSASAAPLFSPRGSTVLRGPPTASPFLVNFIEGCAAVAGQCRRSAEAAALTFACGMPTR